MALVVFKLLTDDELNSFRATGEFAGTALDLRDGYIHMSSDMAQVNRVLGKYYRGVSPVHLLHIRTETLDALRYEPIANGDVYPHQYGRLVFDRDVVSVDTLPNNCD